MTKSYEHFDIENVPCEGVSVKIFKQNQKTKQGLIEHFIHRCKINEIIYVSKGVGMLAVMWFHINDDIKIYMEHFNKDQ